MRRRAAARARRLAPLLALLAAGACIDFVEPEGPAARQPTRLGMTLSLFEDTTMFCFGPCAGAGYIRIPTEAPGGQSALARVEANLEPGTDLAGDPRVVLDSAIAVMGVRFGPVDTTETGVRLYRAAWRPDFDTVPPPFELFVPEIEGAEIFEPIVRWGVPWAVGPDTVVIDAGAGAPLGVRLPDVEDQPQPSFQLWSLELSGATGLVRIGADGRPPEDLVIPDIFLPRPRNGIILARLTITKGIGVRSLNGDYQVTFALQVHLGWVIRVREAAEPTSP